MEMTSADEELKQRGCLRESDTGLSFLLPLYQFLRSSCSEAAHFTLVKGFREAEYVQKYVNEGSAVCTFYDFLKKVHCLGKSELKDQKGKSKGKGKGALQAAKRFTLVNNLTEHVDTLNKVTIQDLIEQNERCEILRDLDLAFVMNVIANDHLQYRLSECVLNAVIQIKEIRNRLFHPKFTFTQEDFDCNFDELVQATEILYHYAQPHEPRSLQSMKKLFQDQAVRDESGLKILEQLKTEVHRKYIVLPTYVPPIIVNEMEQHELVIEDLPKYVLESSQKISPIVLCGAPGIGKSTVLRNLASSSITFDKYALVLYLDNLNRGANDVYTSSEFWEQVFECVKCLASNTVNIYGFEAVKAVIREYMDRILFLVNWNIRSLGSLFRDMQRGTWMLTHTKLELLSNDWHVLCIKPFTENHITELLKRCSFDSQNSVLHLYHSCEYKHLLTSPDMVRVFYELRSAVRFGTDFELIEAFMKEKLKGFKWNVDEMDELIRLGEVAFESIKVNSKHVSNENDLYHIHTELREEFLVHHEGKGSEFLYTPVQEFLAAQYVEDQPNKACREWLSNAPHFINVFKFVCAIWCKNTEDLDKMLPFIEEYLVELFDIKTLKKIYEKQGVELMEIEGKNPKKKEKPTSSYTSLRNAFSEWEYLLALDDVCQGPPKLLRLFAKLLSYSRIWIFKVNEIDGRKLRRIEKVIKNVKLSKESPVTIELKSGADVTLLIELWNKLKNNQYLHDCAFIKIAIASGNGFPFIEQRSLVRLCDTLVRTQCPVYVTSYKGPLLCSTTPEFLKCRSLLELVDIDVTVYDVNSLLEIVKCDDLSHLKNISVNVDMKMDEQHLTEVKQFILPRHPSLILKIKYFDNIQKLLDKAQCSLNLKSLSVYDTYISEKFSLDLSAFRNMEQFSLTCKPFSGQNKNLDNMQRSYVDDHFLKERNFEDMDVDEHILEKKQIPRQSWLLSITVNLIQPEKLEKLVLRNMDFCNNSNFSLLVKILINHNIQKLVILGSQLSLKGVRQILSSRTNDKGDDDMESVTKKLRRNRLESIDVQFLMSERPRLSLEERKQRLLKKPKGKEIVITSTLEVCKRCYHFPCSCLNQSEIEGKDTLDDLVSLIEDLYDYDIVSFNYSSKVVTVSKDVCEDVKVQCVLPGLDDKAAQNLSCSSSESWLNKLFLVLTLAQCIYLEQTQLTFDGAKNVMSYLKHLKISAVKSLEPFSLTISSNYHPSDDRVINKFIKTLQVEKNIFTSLNFWCCCNNKCFKIRKAYSGKITYNDCIC